MIATSLERLRDFLHHLTAPRIVMVGASPSWSLPNPFSEVPLAGSPAPSVSLSARGAGGVPVFKLDAATFMAALLDTSSDSVVVDRAATRRPHKGVSSLDLAAVPSGAAALSNSNSRGVEEQGRLARQSASAGTCVDTLQKPETSGPRGSNPPPRADDVTAAGLAIAPIRTASAAVTTNLDLNAKNIATLLALAESNTAPASTSSTSVRA